MSAPRPLGAAIFVALAMCLFGGILVAVPQAAEANPSTVGVSATPGQVATAPQPAETVAGVARGSEAAQRPDLAQAAAADPVGCGYGEGGQYDDTICWLDMAGYDDTQARLAAGQDMSVTLPGGYTLSYNIKTTVALSGPNRAITAVATPIERQPNGDSRFAFGSEAYRNIPGRPSLYSVPGGAGLDVTLSGIRLEDSSGNPVSSFSFVATDTEDNVASAGESLRWTSDKPLNLIETLYPTTTKGCIPANITGLGTTEVNCVGAGGGSTLAAKSTSILVSADAPSTFALRWITGAQSGIAFGINTASVEVTKVVQGRAATTDSFDVSITSPEGSNLATASTGTTAGATTGRVVVIPPTNGGSFTLTDAVTPGSGTDMGKYTRSWSCTRNGQPDPSLPSGNAASVQVSPGANESIACTVTNTAILDFGDAPSSYGTQVSNNGARHAVGGPTLGTTRDNETDGQPTPNANGDDAAGTDDEDGVAFNTDVSIPGRLESVFVTASSSGFLNAWIDYDGDGEFEPGERIANDVAVSAGANRITHTVPTGAVPGSTFARFRLTSSAGQALSPTGAAPNGEVEDYARAVFDAEQAALDECPAGSTPFPLSFIQNPSFEERTTPSFVNGSANTINFAEHWYDSHPTGGQYHVFEPAPGFNSGPNQATMPFRAGADGHGFLGGHSSGSVGEGATNTLTTPLVAGVTYVGFFSIGAGGYSRNDSGYMRFFGVSDREVGSISHPSVTAPTATNAESLADTITVAPAADGQRAQWKVATFVLTPSQNWDYLRVEARDAVPGGSTGNQAWMSFDDFHLFSCQSTSDFGDAPSAYGTAIGSNPAFHVVSGHNGNGNTAPLMLGSSVDLDSDGTPGPAADGDDTSNADDEDGVSGQITTRAGADTAVRVSATNNTTTVATLVGWIDADRNGTFEASERQTVTVPASSGTDNYTLTFPEPTTAGNTYARFRLFAGSPADPQPTGSAIGGEVEDYAATSEFVSDFGDAPATYGTTTAQDGPRHTVAGYDAQNRTARLSLGATIDDEADGLATTTANGDDGATVDDEDGVTDPISAAIGQPSTVTVSVKNTRNQPATLAGWLDLDRDGTFETGERVTASVPANAGTVTRQLTFPAATVEGVSHARFRVFPADVVDPLPTGPATAGEVEDHPATITQAGPIVTCNTNPAIFNTAYDGNGGEIAPGSRDANWQTGLGDATGPGSVTSWIPAWATGRATGWALSRFGNADWISYYSDTRHSGNVDVYFRYRFRIAPEVSLDAFAMPMNFYADNSVPEVWVNGVAQSAFHTGKLPQSANTYQYAGYSEGNRAKIVLSDSFQHGPNTVVVRVASGQPNMGFMAQVGPSPLCADAGDAPASYGTTKADNGAAHGLEGYDDAAHTADLMLGDSVDADVDGVPSAAADSDDSTRTDDEDALAAVSLAAGATSVNLDVPVTNDTGGTATLHGWIDANGNGAFEAGERASVAVPAGASSATLAWTGLTALADGSRPYLRLRLTTDTLTDNAATTAADERAIGAASDGEVEDHQAVVGSALPTGCTNPFVEDFGTGPNYSGPLPAGRTTYTHRTSGAVQDGSYTLASNINPATMGNWWHSGIDHTVGDTDGLMMLINAAFEPGAFFQRTFSGLMPGATYDFSAWATNALNRTSGILPNITFRVVNPQTGGVIAQVNSGDIPLSTAAQGLIWRRYALQFVAPGQSVRLELVNNAPGGSGNDLALDDISFNLACDWGDAPAGYGTLASDNGPVHPTTGPVLGIARDGEADGLPSTGADGDDIAGTDDEDGAPPISMTVGQQADVTVTVTNNEGQAATLAGWIDLDADGSFEPGEMVSAQVSAGAGTVQRTLTFPGAASTADTYARFRVYPGTPSTVSPTGPAPGGEVEDHPVSIGSATVTCATDPAVFNTAYNGTGGKLATGSRDRVWKVGLGSPTGPASVGNYIPAYVVPPLFNWTPSPFGNADWISYWPDRNQGTSNVDLYFRYRFRIGDDVPAEHLAMSMDFYADNSVPDVWVNGVSQDPLQASLPQAPTNPYGHVGFGSGSQASTVLTGFQTGVNDIVVRVASGPGYAGFMAQMRATLCSDWGDAPNSYGTASPGGASHGVPDFDPADATEELTLGSGVDVESTGTPGAGADGDDTAGSDDEDGVSGALEMSAGSPTTIEVSATANGTATLAGWLDVDGDGTFEAGERVVVPVAAGTDTYDLTFPAGTPASGGTYARFRLFPGNLANPSPAGPASGGEVEDYRVTVLRPGLGIEKTSDATADTRPGDVVTYTVTLTNTGDGAFTAANPARMVDDLGGVLDDATYNGDALATVDGTTVTAPTYAAPRIRWEGPLAAGKSVVVTYSVTVKGGGDGSARNVAWVPTSPEPGPKPDCTSGPVPPPALPLGTELISNGGFTTGGPNGQAVAPPWVFQGSGAVQWSSPFRQPNGVVGPTISFHPGDAGTAGGSIRQVVDDLQVGGTFRLRGRVGLIASAANGAGSSQQMTAQVLDASGAVIATQAVTLPFATGTTWPDPGGVVDLSFVAPTETVTVRFTDTSSGPSFSLNVDMLFDDASVVQTAEATGTSRVPCAASEFLLPKLTVSKTASRNDLPSIGGEITYTVTVRNEGPGTWSADEPGLVDDLSDVEDDATMVGQPTATSGTATYDSAEGELTWTGDLASDDSATITYTFRYDQKAGGNQSLVNSACVPATDALVPEDNCRTTTTPGSGLDQAKTSSPASGTAVDAGDEITYTLRFTNTGQTAASVDTTDDLSDVLDDATLTEGPTADPGLTPTLVGDTLEIDGSVPVGETLLVTYTVTVEAWADQGDHLLRNELACQSPDAGACDPGVVEHPVRRLEVTKSIAQAPADPRPGDEVTYTVTATNVGTGDYTADQPAVVMDDLSAVLDDATLNDGATATIDGNPVAAPTTVGQLLAWSGALPADETVTITYTVTLRGGGDGTVRNTAFVPDCDPGASDCDPTPPDCVRGSDPATGLSCDSEELLLPKLSIAKDASPEQVGAVGDEITYTVTVTNDGPGDYTAAEPATFTDDLSDVLEDATFVAGSATASGGTAGYLAPNLSWSGPLPSGQSVEVTYKVSYTGADDQTLENSACFPAAEAAQGSDECASVTVRGPALSQAKTSDPADGTDVRVGQEIDYTLTFTNDGDVAARVDTVDDLSDVLDDADLVGTPNAEAPLVVTRNGNTLEVTGEVPAGETRTVTYTVVVTAAGDGVLRNSLACQPGEPATCEPEITEHEIQSLEVTKTSDADDDTRVGDTVTYTVTVHNPGAAYTAAEPAVVVDDLTDVLDDGDLVGTPAAEIDGTPAGAPTLTDPRLRWEGPLAADATLVITYQVRLAAGGDGVVRNVVWAPQGPPGTTPDCDDPTLDVPCAEDEFSVPRLSVAKSADRTDLPARGERVTYSVVVRNEGPGNYTAAAPASFADDLSDVLDDATLVDGSITATVGSASFASPGLTWSGALAAGQSATITYTVVYHGEGDRVLANSACVPEAQALDPAADCDTVTVPGSGLVQTKTSDPADGSAVRAGQEITYTLSFTNHGQASARVETTDDLSAVLDDADLTAGPTAQDGLGAVLDGDLLRITGSVPAGETRTVTYTVTVSPYGDQGDHVLRNSLACPPGSPTACQPETTVHPVRHLVVSKTSDATDAVDTGSVVTYTVTVLNDGTTAYTAGDPASFVDDLSDVLDDAVWNDDAETTSGELDFSSPTLTWTGPLGVGASVTITYSVTVTNVGDHDLRNTVDVPGCDDGCEPPPVVTPLPYVVPDKTVDPPSGTAVSAGQVVTYTLSWTNHGQAVGAVDATDDLSDVLDDARLTGAPVSSDPDVVVTRDGDTLRIEGPIDPGQTVTVTYQVTVRPDGQRGDNRLGNVLSPDVPQVDCDDTGDCDPVDPPDTENPVGEYEDWKTADPVSGSNVEVGERITYTLHFSNTGNGDVEVDRDDVVTRVLDDAVLVRGPKASSSALSVTKVIKGRFSIKGVVEPGQKVTVSYVVEVKPRARLGDLDLANFLVDDGERPPRHCNVGTSRAADRRKDCTEHHVRTYDLTVAKDLMTDSPVGVGTMVKYRIVVTNKGPDGATSGMKVLDDLPSGLDLRSARGKGWDCSLRQGPDFVTCVRTKALARGAKTPPIVVVAKVRSSAAGSRVVNTAKVAGAGDTNPDNNDDPAVLVVEDIPPLPDTGLREVVPGELFG